MPARACTPTHAYSLFRFTPRCWVMTRLSNSSPMRCRWLRRPSAACKRGVRLPTPREYESNESVRCSSIFYQTHALEGRWRHQLQRALRAHVCPLSICVVVGLSAHTCKPTTARAPYVSYARVCHAHGRNSPLAEGLEAIGGHFAMYRVTSRWCGGYFGLPAETGLRITPRPPSVSAPLPWPSC